MRGVCLTPPVFYFLPQIMLVAAIISFVWGRGLVFPALLVSDGEDALLSDKRDTAQAQAY
ncbi:hypothetical protein GCM10007972_19120 [Iodidimonas muriae]|uniref:Uncharacterized protein n=1 Tax=Iodidimonas muriae TaxID=261467 RepID=A0ABQ2LEB6_9PROT|nr:hypothetical protein JCM17843_13650 [Kordiimonadales bacterium JCM 17843]GGO13179.1 hypothetical protein GCM10007972_19120 [Iodidimonas muriae]